MELVGSANLFTTGILIPILIVMKLEHCHCISCLIVKTLNLSFAKIQSWSHVEIFELPERLMRKHTTSPGKSGILKLVSLSVSKIAVHCAFCYELRYNLTWPFQWNEI